MRDRGIHPNPWLERVPHRGAGLTPSEHNHDRICALRRLVRALQVNWLDDPRSARRASSRQIFERMTHRRATQRHQQPRQPRRSASRNSLAAIPRRPSPKQSRQTCSRRKARIQELRLRSPTEHSKCCSGADGEQSGSTRLTKRKLRTDSQRHPD